MTISTTDWKKLDQLLEDKLEQKLTEKIDPIKEQISHLPNKKTFYHYMDKWMKAASIADIEKPLHKREHSRIRDYLDLHSPRT